MKQFTELLKTNLLQLNTNNNTTLSLVGGGIGEGIAGIFRIIFMVIFSVVILGIILYTAYTLLDIAKNKEDQEKRSNSFKHLGFLAGAFFGVVIIAAITFTAIIPKP